MQVDEGVARAGRMSSSEKAQEDQEEKLPPQVERLEVRRLVRGRLHKDLHQVSQGQSTINNGFSPVVERRKDPVQGPVKRAPFRWGGLAGQATFVEAPSGAILR